MQIAVQFGGGGGGGRHKTQHTVQLTNTVAETPPPCFLLGMWQIFDLYSIRTRIVPFSPEFCISDDYCPPPDKSWMFTNVRLRLPQWRAGTVTITSATAPRHTSCHLGDTVLRAVNRQSMFERSRITKSWMRGLCVELVRERISMKKKKKRQRIVWNFFFF